MNEQNQLIEIPQSQNYQMQQFNPDDIMKWMPIAAEFTKSGLFSQIKNPAQAFAIIQYGLEVGLTPFISLQTINIISGKPAINAQAMLSIAKAKSGVDWNILEETNKKCVIEFTRGTKKYVCEYTIEDAKAMGLTEKDNWKKQPATMLFSRCASKGVRRIAPECIIGLYTPEETAEFTEHQGFSNAKPVEANVVPPEPPAQNQMEQFIQEIDDDSVYQTINTIRSGIDAKRELNHPKHLVRAMKLFVKDEFKDDYKYALELFGKNDKAFYKTYETYFKKRCEATNPPATPPPAQEPERNDPLDVVLNSEETPEEQFIKFLRFGEIAGQFCTDYFGKEVDAIGKPYRTTQAMIDSHIAFVKQDPALGGEFSDALELLGTGQGAKMYAISYLKWIKEPVRAE